MPKKSERKISSKRKATGDYKWAKVLGWEIDDVKKRLKAVEKTIKLICETLSIDIEGDKNAEKKKL